MLDDAAQYTYKGQTFQSKEAMEAYMTSRAAVSVKPSTNGPPMGLIAVGVVLLAMVISAMKESPKAPIDVAPAQSAPSASSDTRKTMALLINMHGELCANVNTIERISGDVYRVKCTRYRDGTGSATFEVNAAAGTVK